MQDDRENNLFVYGTLIDPEIYQLVTGKKRSSIPTRMKGFKVLRVRNQVFPGMISSPDSSATGALYQGLSELELLKLDHYEDDFYERKLIQCEINTDETVLAWAYIIPKEFHSVLSTSDWHYSDFLKKDRDGFISDLRSYFKD